MCKRRKGERIYIRNPLAKSFKTSKASFEVTGFDLKKNN